MKSPAFQFYPGDWRRDLALQACPLRCRGLWIEMMALMHDGVPYGHLATERGPIAPPALAQLVGTPLRVVVADLAHLKAAGVYSVTETGVVYSRRMVRDERLRQQRRDWGSLGAHDHETAVAYGRQGGRPKGVSGNPVKGVSQKGVKTPPASASASAVGKNKSARPAGAAGHVRLLTGFDQFKAAYPKRAKWPDAEKAWRQVGASAHLAAILADVARRRESPDWQDQGGRFIPLPASYLRGRRWEDEPGVSGEVDPYAGEPHLWECACGEIHEGVRGQPRPACPTGGRSA